MREVFEKIVTDPRYQRNLDWGKARRGHPEGAVRAHIAELEQNLEALKDKLSEDKYWKLKVLVHTHDTFKADALSGVAIIDPKSHASLARKFLAEYCQDPDLLNMVQYHDEGYALWQQYSRDGRYNRNRFNALLATIKDWDLFLLFNIVDGCTKGKDREKLKWFLNEVRDHVETSVTPEWIL